MSRRRVHSRAAPRNFDARRGSPPVTLVFQPSVGTAGYVPNGAKPYPTEANFMDIAAHMEERQFESEEELRAFVDQYMQAGTKPDIPLTSLPWHRAMRKAYEGWESNTAVGRGNAARDSLEIFPDLPDPHLLMAVEASSWEEAHESCERAVAAGERWLGPDREERYQDAFWSAAITRPYMRARFARACCAWRLGRLPEARAELEDLLRLNPGDNQGIRYVLVAVLMEQSDFQAARTVIGRYGGEVGATPDYNWALIEFGTRGRGSRANRRLNEAVQKNPTILWRLQEGKPRRSEVSHVEPGGESEAIEYWLVCHQAWEKTPGALDWLRERYPHE